MRDPSCLRLPRPRDRTIAAVFAILLAGELLTNGSGSSPAWSLVCAAALAAPLLILRSHPPAAAIGEAAVLVLVSLTSVAQPAPVLDGAVIVCALSFCCGAYAPLRDGVIGVSALIAALQVSMGFAEFPNIEIAFGTLVPLWVGYQVGLRNSLVDRLAIRTRELTEEEDTFAQLSVRLERARIARELHDIVAHHLAVIVVQAGAGRIAAASFDQRARERLDTIGVASRHALTDMARLVDLLSDTQQNDTETRWSELVATAEAGGLTVTIDDLATVLGLPDAVEQTAYRALREGLTNAIKYAPGAQVHVEVTSSDGVVEIQVRDTGAARPTTLHDAGGGLGLAGIRDRVHAAGGTFQATPILPRGWEVQVTLPIIDSHAPAAVAPSTTYPARMTPGSLPSATTRPLRRD